MNNIKRKVKGIVMLTGLSAILLLPSCDSGFEQMNINPNAYTTPILGNLLTTSQIRGTGVGTNDRNRTNIKYFAGTMQYMASLGTNWSGDKNFENSQFGDLYTTIYTSHLRELIQLIDLTKDDAAQVNINAIARIWRVFLLQRATDAYGDVPYSEAGLGYINGTIKPKFDKQSEIYPAMLTEVEAAIAQLDAAKSNPGSSDIIYGGSVPKWKTFGNSLLLRLAMRISNVDPATAQSYVQKAVAGGVMTSNADIARVLHAAGNGNTQNWDSFELKRESLPESNQGKGPVKLGKTLIDMLQALSDPRLPFYATLWRGNILSTQSAQLLAQSAANLQKGLPSGQDANSIGAVVPGWSNDKLVEYSEPNTGTVAHLAAPSILMSYSEVEFLLADAALKGWAPGVSAAAHYANAIRANMQSTTLWPNAGLYPFTATTIDNYIAANPITKFGSDTESVMRQIYTQFYLAHYMYFDNFEAWSTLRRTGYPTEIVPPNYPGNFTGGKLLLRLRYPVSEQSLNPENYNAAVATQGPDLYTTPVWWDTKHK